jgi:pimeloyl-ACP methyl ester carboxylesterase
MLRRRLLLLATLTISSPVFPQTNGEAIMIAPKSGFAPVNGLSLYFEIHGSGEPLVMLHGGIGATEMLGPNLEELARTRQVIVPHMQGHGFTKDIDRPYDYPQFADDLAALLDHLRIARADVMGYSLGAGIAIRLTIQHPDKVRKLISVSGTLTMAGQYPEVVAAFPEMVKNAAEIGAGVAASPMAGMYPDINWETAFRKMGEMASGTWNWTEEVASIEVPVLLVFADADSVVFRRAILTLFQG